MGINLKTSASSTKREKINFGKALPFVVAFTVIILLVYVGILLFQKNIEGQIANEKAVLQGKTEEFKNGNAKDVLDFQNRISESKTLIGEQRSKLSVLDEIQNKIVAGVFLNSFQANLETGEVSLDCRAETYEQVSKQILAFKKSNFFSSVESGKTSVLEQEGLIGFEINLVILKENL